VIKYQLAAATLAIWEDDVRRFAPEAHYQWQLRLESLPDEVLPEDLRNALAPIAAKSDREQALFAAIFERARAEVEEVNKQSFLPTGPPPAPMPGFWKKYGRWLIATGLLLLTAIAIFLFLTDKKIPVIQKEFAVTAGQKASLCPKDFSDIPVFRTTVANFSIRYSQFLNVKREKTSWLERNEPAPPATINHGSALANFSIQNDTCLAYTARDSVKGMDSLVLRATFSNGTKCDLQLRMFVGPKAEQEVIPTHKKTAVTYRFFPHEPPFNHDQLIRNLEFKPAGPLGVFLDHWGNWLKTILLLALAGLLYRWVQWRARNRRKLVAQRDKSAKPPYVWNIRIKDLAPPDPGEAFGLTINSLRRRTDDETRLIDLPETVRATIRKGGMAMFQYRKQTRPPEYLMLVDRHHAHDHRARLYDDLFHILRQNEVLVERFFFDGDIRLCTNEQYPEGLTPDELLFRFPNHRLLIIGTGRQMISATTGQLAKWTEQFGRWKDRALLSPLPAAEWGRRERTLAELFRFAPASLPGMRRLIEAFEADETLQAPQFEKLAALAIGDPVLLEDGDLLQTLEKHYPDELTRTWLAACALWPELQYDLTLWLGQWLDQESGQPVATMDRLGDLLRLPWFANGEMPDPVRALLIDWMRVTNPTLETRLRTALHSLLEENAPPDDSAAWDDFSMQVAFNEWQITTDPKRKKELEDQMARWIEKNGDPDFIVIRELKGKPGPLDSMLPDSWKQRFFKGKIPALGLRETWKDAIGFAFPLWAVVGLMLWFWGNPKAPDCREGLERVVVGKDTLSICPSSPEARLLLSEYKLRAAAGQGDEATFDSLNKKAFDQNLDLLRECLANISNAAFNAGIPSYRHADSLLQTISNFKIDTSVSKMLACRWFDRASHLDDSTILQSAKDWCSNSANGGSPLANPGSCYHISPSALPLAFRNRTLTQVEFNEIGKFQGQQLDQSTLITVFTESIQVTLMDSTRTSYQIEYNGKIGFIAKAYLGRSTLVSCDKRQAGAVSGLPGLQSPSSIPLPDMVFVAGGTFTMGCTAEQGKDCFESESPAHLVTVSDFSIGKTEITNEQFCAFLNERGNQEEGGATWINLEGRSSIEKCRIQSDGKHFSVEKGYEKHPVIYVSWYGSNAYCSWLSQKTGKKYRLPTEAEWEYAARGGQKKKGDFKYSGGDDIDKVAWYTENTNDAGTRPVATKKANDLDVFDMSGNVYEWCADWYEKYGAGEKAVLNPTGAKNSSSRVIRGGSWSDGAQFCRVSGRNYAAPGNRRSNLGFRLVSSPQ
jgi:formylglycine-generating enzyme required for sulfatase activity